MIPPLLSTFTLATEILVTTAVLYVFYRGYRYNQFPKKVALFAISYETIFNITYMAHRAATHELEHPEATHSPLHTGLAIFHGTLSLIMFLSLIIFFSTAYRRYKTGTNFFSLHPYLSGVFLFWWFLSIGSGVALYYIAYFTNL